MPEDASADVDASVDAFIERWSVSGAAERANFQPFLSELCELLGVEKPWPSTEIQVENTYAFERGVTFTEDPDRERGQIDLYRRGCFVMEAKQGSGEVEPLPDSLPGRMRAIRQVVEASGEPLSVEEIASRFHYARRDAVRELLETLEALGHTGQPEEGRYVG